LDLTQAKLDIASGNFAPARESLKRANSYFRSVKLEMTLVGLRTVPRLTRLVTAAWSQLLMAPERLHSFLGSRTRQSKERVEKIRAIARH
jgi:hypothetical protein